MKERQEKRQDEEREMKEKIFLTNVSRPSNPPDEVVQNVSKKSPSDDLFLHFSWKVQNLTVFSNCLHDSNSIFRAWGIKSEWFRARSVHQPPRVGALT